ncbi:MAG: UDP-N-acetylmuramoyl-L-alanyl-D-glutamate--2,6-diaminopimelate ligase [Candidatus Anoxychlamydiales bacterium]|nr:UDP-N-acetylmuramoyl-L-alanyl-D-glutamate--2,6-diaminopimelate ligase [Candidatus Anoxychlamydiales bacterium]
MKLKTLFKNIKYKTIKGKKDIDISGICSDSRYVSINNLFIAKKGLSYDGSNFIIDAINAGAIAIVTNIYNPFIKATQIIVDDPASIEADIAEKFYGTSSNDILKIAITGTNGKTTTSYLIKHVLDNINIKSGLIGSIEYILGNNKLFSTNSTPGVVLNHKYIHEMKKNNLKALVIEATSHGLDQDRLKKIEFDISIFTNFTQDHLDYHENMQKYFSAKKKLFDNLKKDSIAIVNLDDEKSLEIVKNTKAKVYTISTKKKASLKAYDINCTLEGSYFFIDHENEKHKIFIPLIGIFNVYNALSCIQALLLKKIKLVDIIKALKTFKNIKGRLEKVNSTKRNIFVDFAHTDDALINVLSNIKKLTKARIINIFGCGGNRDSDKRKKMAIASEKYADISIVTSDNPRNEDPKKIIDEIILGFSKKDSYIVIEDRKMAIEKAIELSKKEDIILISGKGHETYQIIKDKKHDFNDVKIAESFLNSQKGIK